MEEHRPVSVGDIDTPASAQSRASPAPVYQQQPPPAALEAIAEHSTAAAAAAAAAAGAAEERQARERQAKARARPATDLPAEASTMATTAQAPPEIPPGARRMPHQLATVNGGRPIPPVPARLLSKRNNIPRISVYINRNLQRPREQVLVDERRTPTWNLFLDQLTATLDDSILGVVQTLVNADTGEAVSGFRELQDGGTYVACGKKSYKKLNYGAVTDYKERRDSKGPAPMPKAASRRLSKKLAAGKKGMYLAGTEPPLVIYCIKNGDSTGDYTQVILDKRDRVSWEKVIEAITDRMASILENGAVKKVYTLEGEEVTRVNDLRDIRHGGVYVAADRLPVKLPSVELTSDGIIVPVTRSESPTKATRARREQTMRARKPPAHLRKTSIMDGLGDMKAVAKQAIKHEAKVVYIFLFDEAVAEVLAEVLDEEDKRLKSMRQQLSEYTSKLRGHEITHRFDHLIGNILDYAQSQESRLWQTPENDAEEQIFEASEAAARGLLRHWEGDTRALTALLVLLDQIPRARFPNSKKVYDRDYLAIQVLQRAITVTRLAHDMEPWQQLMACFVLSRQENMNCQDMCVAVWESARDALPANFHSVGESFYDNRDIIARFGRFPRRNAILGRETTREERDFLKPKPKAVAENGSTASAGRKRFFSWNSKGSGDASHAPGAAGQKGPPKRRGSRILLRPSAK